MPIETVVSPVAIGAARVTHYWHTESGSDYSSGMEKPTPTIQSVISSWNQTGPDGVTNLAVGADRLFIRLEQVNGVWLRVLKMQGSVVYRPLLQLTTVRPGANFTRSFGRHVWGGLFNWSAAPAAGVDSGIGFGVVDHARILPGSAQNNGMLLGNVAGVLKFVSRGAGGYEEVDLSAFANPLSEWNRIELMLRHATKDSDASVTAVINGVNALTRYWSAGHKLPVPPAATGEWRPMQTHLEVATYLRSMELTYYAGPDVELL